jgi:PPOX class probable F420-dependent enzyme
VNEALPDQLIRLLKAPNPAVMATVRSDGSPQTVATWYELEADGRILLNLDATRVRLAHLRRRPEVAMTVLDGDSWYRHVSLRLSVAEIADDDGMQLIDRLAIRYLGVPYQKRDQHRVNVWLTIDSWFGWDATTFKDDGAAAPMQLDESS